MKTEDIWEKEAEDRGAVETGAKCDSMESMVHGTVLHNLMNTRLS